MKVAYDKSKGRIYKVLCPICKNVTRHLVLSSIDTSGSEPMDDENNTYYWNSNFQIIECQGCDTISFRNEQSNSEEFQDGVDEFLFPKRSLRSLNEKSFLNVPFNLRRIYRETIDCFNNGNVTLCGAGVRALVEGLCQENGITEGEVDVKDSAGNVTGTRRDTNLQGKINGLFQKGKLTKDNAEILHEHRLLGNQAIHELERVSEEELTLAIEIIEHTLDNLYEIPEKASRLKAKRLAKPKT